MSVIITEVVRDLRVLIHTVAGSMKIIAYRVLILQQHTCLLTKPIITRIQGFVAMTRCVLKSESIIPLFLKIVGFSYEGVIVAARNTVRC